MRVMFTPFFFLIISFLSITFGNVSSEYLLIPKAQYDNLDNNLEVHVSFNDLVIYKIPESMYLNSYFSFLENFYVEKNKIIHAFDTHIFVQSPGQSYFTIQNNIPWHLTRISNKNLTNENQFPYNYSKSCHQNHDLDIHTYILDTGIDVDHEEFEGRATWLANFADDNINTDCNSHGTHCAGLVGSKSYGVCKDSKLFAVKVLNCEGAGTVSGILKGLEYVYNRHKSQFNLNTKIRSILSMSLGGGFSFSINRAVEELVKINDIFVVVAAGNENNDACNVSPASANGVITVMASDSFDSKAYFSNYGPCADIYSPGVNILSTIPNNSFAIYSGTSMATPIVAGVLNHYIDMFPTLDNKEIKTQILNDSTKNAVKKNPNKTNNLLIYLERS